MKNIDSSLKTILETAGIQIPISKVELFQTPWVASSYGINMLAWKDDLDTTRTPDFGTHINDTYSVLTDSGVAVVENIWSQNGTGRPLNYSNLTDVLVRYEGYFYAPSSSIDFKVVCNASGHLYVDSGVTYPSGCTNKIIDHQATDNSDSLAGTTASIALSGGGWYPFRFDHYMPPGSFSKASVLWKNSSESSYKLLDTSNCNTTSGFLTPLVLTGVTDISWVDEKEKPSTVSFSVPQDASSNYTYNPDTDSYGELRPNRFIKVYVGSNSQERGNTPLSTDYVQLGCYHIEDVSLDKTDRSDVLSITATNTLKKASDMINLPLLPDLISYDLMGISSDTVFDGASGTQRYYAFDSWKLSDVIRILLYKSGFTTDQVWAIDSNGDLKIVAAADSIYLDRGRTYRLSLGRNADQQDLKYEFDPQEKLLNIINELVEQYNYEFYIDHLGHAVLKEANNGTFYLASEGSTTDVTKFDSIDSFGAAYYQPTDQVAGNTFSLTPSSYKGFDLIFDRTISGGVVTIKKAGTPITGWSTYDMSYGKNWQFRNGIDPDIGSNPCVLEILRGAAASTDAISIVTSGDVRFAGYTTYSDDRDFIDLSLDMSRITKLDTEHTYDNLRNDVTVVGDEKGYNTDEYFISRSIDIKSVTNPAAKNFVGENRKFVVPQTSVRRQDVLDHISYTLIKRHRTLSDLVSFDTPFLPHLEVGDTIGITDSGSGMTGNLFWINQIRGTVSPNSAAMSVRLDTERPLSSFQAIKEPSNPTSTISGFQFYRTDGVSIDPDLSVTNVGSLNAGPSVQGYYSGKWSEDNPPTFIKIDFDLYRSSYVTLEVKDLYTHKTLVVLEQDNFLEYGSQSYLWDGKVWNADHSSYVLFPSNPEWNTVQWQDYQDRDDLFLAPTNRDRAGYYYVEASVTPVEVPSGRDIYTAVNADDTAKMYGKVILHSPGGVSIHNNDQPQYASGVGIPYGRRYDVFDDEWLGSFSTYGLKINTVHDIEPMRFVFKGYLDHYTVLAQSTSAITANDKLIYTPQIWDEESLSAGRHLYYLQGGTDPILTNGTTEFLDAGEYEFIIDLTNMPLKIDNGFYAKRVTYNLDPVTKKVDKIYLADILRDGKFDWEVVEWRFRNNYISTLNAMYKNYAVVGASFVFGTMVEAYNKAGERLYLNPDMIQAYPLRPESRTVSGNKHFVWPPVNVPQGGTSLPAGHWARMRERKQHDGAYTATGSRIVHFTSANNSISFSYD